MENFAESRQPQHIKGVPDMPLTFADQNFGGTQAQKCFHCPSHKQRVGVDITGTGKDFDQVGF